MYNSIHFFRLKILLLSIAFSTLSAKGQYHQITSIPIELTPRRKANYDKEGQYEVVAVANKKQLNKGEYLDVDVYFTGYGEIGLSKVFIVFSQNIVDSNNSIVTTSLKPLPNNRLMWGNETFSINEITVLDMTGGIMVNKNNKDSASQYIDMTNEPADFGIITETKIQNAPISISYKIKDDIQEGEYSIAFYYTYFDGVKWKSSNSNVQFKVNSFIEEHILFFTVAGLVVAIIAAIPVIFTIVEFYQKKLPKKTSKKTVLKKAIPKKT